MQTLPVKPHIKLCPIISLGTVVDLSEGQPSIRRGSKIAEIFASQGGPQVSTNLPPVSKTLAAQMPPVPLVSLIQIIKIISDYLNLKVNF
jgi:hypothetical protein